jgi:hypothetical protein
MIGGVRVQQVGFREVGLKLKMVDFAAARV